MRQMSILSSSLIYRKQKQMAKSKDSSKFDWCHIMQHFQIDGELETGSQLVVASAEERWATVAQIPEKK